MYIDVTAGEAGSGSQWIAESGVLDLFILLVRGAGCCWLIWDGLFILLVRGAGCCDL